VRLARLPLVFTGSLHGPAGVGGYGGCQPPHGVGVPYFPCLLHGPEKCATWRTKMCRSTDAVAHADGLPLDGIGRDREGRDDDAHREANKMRLREAHVGARVRVSYAYRKPALQGSVGSIEKLWGEPHYAAVEVRLDDGSSELLWRHEVEELREVATQKAFASLRWT
jgi:hypothetical protein